MALTNGAVQSIYNEQDPKDPCLQVIDLKKLGNGKIRTILSDGTHYIMGMFATQLTQLIETGELLQNSIIRLQTYSLNNMGGKKVMIVLKVAVIQRDSEAIGKPCDVASAPAGAAPPAAPPSAAVPPPQYLQQQQQQPQFGASAPVPAPQQSYAAPPLYGGSAAPSAPSSSFGGGGGGAIAKAEAGGTFQPIDSLNPYQNRWTIKARITSKGDMKSWNNARGSGTLFKIELLDDRGGEIAACFFKETAEKFYPLLEVNQVYTFANGRLKVANKQYSSCSSDYEITFGNDADIRLCAEDANIGAVKFNFRKFDVLEHAEPNSTVDVCGVVKRSGDLVELVSKRTGSTLYKRDLTLADDSGIEVVLTVWGDKAKEDDAQWQNGPVLGVKKCKVSDFNGVSLSTLGSSQLIFEPEVAETQALHAWWAAAGASSEGKSLTQARGAGGGIRDTALTSRSTLETIKEGNLGHSEKGDFVTIKGMVDFILKREGAEGPWYVSDPETKYKCTEGTDGSWYCERLDKTIQNPKRRFIMTCSVKDHTGSQLVSLFDDQAVQLLGHTADEIFDMQVSGQEARAEAIYKKALFTECYLSLRVKMESYNDEARQKVVVTAMAPVNFEQECAQLTAAINAFQ